MSRHPISKPFEYDKSPDILRFSITPYKIVTQSSTDALTKGIVKEKVDEPMIFLAPMTFQENTIHEWANYDSLGTRFAQKFNQLETLTADVATSVKNLGSGNSGHVITKKLDTPMTFSDSNRRVLVITFQLVDQGDTEIDVFTPVRLLQQYSCAEKKNSTFDFDLPYIFTVETINSNLVYIENAALGSVQPTWIGPYRNGYPSKCELTLDFKDIEPLYRRTFDSTKSRMQKLGGRSTR